MVLSEETPAFGGRLLYYTPGTSFIQPNARTFERMFDKFTLGILHSMGQFVLKRLTKNTGKNQSALNLFLTRHFIASATNFSVKLTLVNDRARKEPSARGIPE